MGLILTCFFHACGSQLLSIEMPGSKRVFSDSFIARRMHDTDPTEDQISPMTCPLSILISRDSSISSDQKDGNFLG